jgi:hypothetical protein
LLRGREQCANLLGLRFLNFLLLRNRPFMDFIHPRAGFIKNQPQLGYLRIRQTETLLHESHVPAPVLLGSELGGVLALARHRGHGVQPIAENTQHGSAHEDEAHVERDTFAREVHR